MAIGDRRLPRCDQRLTLSGPSTIPPIVVTLGTLTIYRGMAFVLSGRRLGERPSDDTDLPFRAPHADPRPAGSKLGRDRNRALDVYSAEMHTQFGRSAYATGGNPTAAVYAGIDTGWTKFLAFVLSGALAGLCRLPVGLALRGRLCRYRQPASSSTAVAACVIGGISIAGGVGSVIGTVLGALFLGVIKNALPVIGISPFTQMAISGTVIILAVVFNARRERSRGRIILRDKAAAETPAEVVRMSTFSAPTEKRVIPDRLGTPFRRIMASWEVLLFGVAILIFVFNSMASPYFLNAWNLSDATFNFTEKAMIAFAMALLVIAGEIDLSVAAIIALASTAMGAAAQAGIATPGLVLIGIGTGLVCGVFNGVLVSALKLPSIVVTIGTMSLFRGISYIVLGDQAYGKYPADFAYFGQGYVVWVFSFEFVLFFVLAILFAILLHATNFRPPGLCDRQ